ncbi:hypothetical protein NFI96_029710, partial [Prochilodus magdalenae]
CICALSLHAVEAFDFTRPCAESVTHVRTMTREEELIRIAKTLDKMVSRNNMEGALDLLRELKNFNMTLKLLQDTRIGMSVNAIRKHCTDEDVVSLAKILIKNWKRLLESAHSQKDERPNELKNGSDGSKQTEASSGPSPDRPSSPKSILDSHKKLPDKHRKEKKEAELKKERQESENKKEKHSTNHAKERDRNNVFNSSVFGCSSPPHPTAPPKCSTVEVRRERKEAFDPQSSPYPLNLQHPPPPHIRIPKRQPEVKKDRRDVQEMLPPTPSQHSHSHRSSSSPPPLPPPPKKPSLEVPKERKESSDPDAPIPPLPLHLHPPTPTKQPLLDMKKDKEKERDVGDSKPHKRPSVEVKKERKDSTDFKQQPAKKPIQDGKKESRKDSTDSKSGQGHLSSESKAQRKDSTDSKSGQGHPSSELKAQRRDSHGSKSAPPVVLQRKMSTDSNDGRKSKPETPKTPTTPTSPLSPSFGSGAGPLSPRLLTGESIRDKCIEMLSAALRTDDDYKDYGANCDAMAAEIEDHILSEIKATDMKYKNRVRSRISNLKDPKNPNLRKNVLGGAIELSRIATMTAEEMASDELKQLRNVLTQEAIREHQMAKTGGTTTDLLQCGKCKKKNCTYNQVQTRSADEPMTTFVLCNECGNRWKFC